MDSRLDVFGALGLREGEAHVLRNAGGIITDDVIRSLALSQRQARHARGDADPPHRLRHGEDHRDGFREELRAATGMAPPFAVESFTDVRADVRQSIERVRQSPFLLHRDEVRGFVYDVDTHRLTEVETE